ncbi:hypothetical protein AB1Y20_017462 [Prymnesium parvum]|uniref:Uncharacterized protein n=1 Tax=Prymnesium parvum TaxID=97485 RepID=A0AB34JPI0_PRYPA
MLQVCWLTLLLPHGAAALRVSAEALAQFEGYSMQRELAFAQSAALKASELLQRPEGSVHAARELLSQMIGSDERGRWLWHVDAQAVVVSLMGEEDPVLGLVHSPSDGETIVGTAGGGAFALEANGVRSCAAGGASMRATVLHLPAEEQWSPRLDAFIEHLENTGTGMPVEVRTKGGHSCCEGLREVVLSRADFHLAPPAAFIPQQPTPSAAVLGAFGLILEESGGSLSDAYGEPIDILRLVDEAKSADGEEKASSSALRHGILAGPDVMVPYICRAIKASFPANEMDGSLLMPPSFFEGSLRQQFDASAFALPIEFVADYDDASQPETSHDVDDDLA